MHACKARVIIHVAMPAGIVPQPQGVAQEQRAAGKRRGAGEAQRAAADFCMRFLYVIMTDDGNDVPLWPACNGC